MDHAKAAVLYEKLVAAGGEKMTRAYIPAMDKKVIEEHIKVAAGDLVDTVKKLAHEGNVRRIIVRNAEGRTLVEMPLSAGVAGALLLPFFAMVAGFVALFKEFTVVVERHDTGGT